MFDRWDAYMARQEAEHDAYDDMLAELRSQGDLPCPCPCCGELPTEIDWDCPSANPHISGPVAAEPNTTEANPGLSQCESCGMPVLTRGDWRTWNDFSDGLDVESKWGAGLSDIVALWAHPDGTHYVTARCDMDSAVVAVVKGERAPQRAKLLMESLAHALEWLGADSAAQRWWEHPALRLGQIEWDDSGCVITERQEAGQ